ncbi:SOS response-associated peptidase [Pseudomonas sp. JG-B]|nr:SOS response-associated peptidase [Pseudomonas sp. JG-B]
MSCALITKEAAPSVAFVHHRMQVILAPQQFDLWLTPDAQSEQIQRCHAVQARGFRRPPGLDRRRQQP